SCLGWDWSESRCSTSRASDGRGGCGPIRWSTWPCSSPSSASRRSFLDAVEIVRLHLARLDAFNEIPVHGFVIKHPRAGAILVDTGVGWPTELVKEWKVVNRHAADALAEHDLSPTDVKIVINSHLHFDHCGQNAVFKHAPFYIQRSELTRARKQETVAAKWFDFAGARFELLDGDAEITDGVRTAGRGRLAARTHRRSRCPGDRLSLVSAGAPRLAGVRPRPHTARGFPRPGEGHRQGWRRPPPASFCRPV